MSDLAVFEGIFFLGAQNWIFVQVSADAKNQNPTLENLLGVLD